MGKLNKKREFEFNQIITLIEEARTRTFQKVNAELVLLYFKVGAIVFTKVKDGNWGDNTVADLSVFIEEKFPELKGFNRRGLYRMKQLYRPAFLSPRFAMPCIV